MHLTLCIDDTDNLAAKQGTGHLADQLMSALVQEGWGTGSMVVRHQLFVHPNIPYTSHNSAMSFTLESNDEASAATIADFCGAYLLKHSLEGSDPGLCIVEMHPNVDFQPLIDFGRRAKCEVLCKEAAYELARKTGVHLSEHGGTGMGVIGALAGAGLRIWGNDGRVRVKHAVNTVHQVASVGDILTQTRIDAVQTLDGHILGVKEIVLLGEKVKSVYMGGKSILLVIRSEELGGLAPWKTCAHRYLKENY